MPDPLRSMLNDEADRRVADEPVPPVSVIRGRAAEQRPRMPRGPVVSRLMPALLVPVMVAALVSGMVVGVQQLRPVREVQPAVVVPPPPPVLGVVVPPVTVRKRLGAAFGHSTGPPVATADLLAVSPVPQGSLTLKTVGVVKARPKDAHVPRRVDRCLVTYTDPGARDVKGECLPAFPAVDPTPAGSVTLAILGPPGQTWLSGTAPVGTAAVVFRSEGQAEMTVPTGDPGKAWSNRPHYAAWWPRTATDLVAVGQDGRELGRTRLPSDVPVRSSPDDPELGTLEPPLDFAKTHLDRRRSPWLTGPVDRLDVLARLPLGGVTVWKFGLVQGDNCSIFDFVQDLSGDGRLLGSGGGGCPPSRLSGDADIGGPINHSRSWSEGTGQPHEQLISGYAPPGTRRIRLSAPGLASREIPAYDGGTRWENRSYFTAAWPSDVATTITALDGNGSTLATVDSKRLNLRASEPDHQAAVASCMESQGVKVVRTPQPGGAGPSYEFKHGHLGKDRRSQLDELCERAADRKTGRGVVVAPVRRPR